ncbi:hypothetical protein CEK25_001370 [Fusarium fujikuroi]|nr:hypothetical protein CEK25_001370 [Fusarium fujikuroi]
MFWLIVCRMGPDFRKANGSCTFPDVPSSMCLRLRQTLSPRRQLSILVSRNFPRKNERIFDGYGKPSGSSKFALYLEIRSHSRTKKITVAGFSTWINADFQRKIESVWDRHIHYERKADLEQMNARPGSLPSFR